MERNHKYGKVKSPERTAKKVTVRHFEEGATANSVCETVKEYSEMFRESVDKFCKELEPIVKRVSLLELSCAEIKPLIERVEAIEARLNAAQNENMVAETYIIGDNWNQQTESTTPDTEKANKEPAKKKTKQRIRPKKVKKEE